jgi:hypothetical protein
MKKIITFLLCLNIVLSAVACAPSDRPDDIDNSSQPGVSETERGNLSLVRIKLHTGRTHQIRVQFASRGMPLFGDGKYGAKDNFPRVSLLSRRLSFPHPKSGKRMDFSIDKPSEFPWDLFE